MTPEELRADMPATDGTAYFNTGASGPPPRRVVEAMHEAQSEHAFESPGGEGMYPYGFDRIDEARTAVAALLGADTDEIALTQSTTDGINLVADSLRWSAGDRVVRTDLEHPAGRFPWQRLRDVEGVSVTTVGSEAGRLDLDAMTDAVQDATLVCLSALSWNYGTQLRVREVADIAHDAGALVLVDGVQTPGQLPTDPASLGADFFVGAGHKWLLGPWGAGFLYVSADALEDARPRRVGAASVSEPYAHEYTFAADASRFEVSTQSVASYAGLTAAIGTIRSVGLDTIRARIERLTDRLKAGVPEDRLLSPREYESGLVTIAAEDPDGLVDRLAADDIVLRTLPSPEAVRVSVHAFNTAAEIDALLERL